MRKKIFGFTVAMMMLCAVGCSDQQETDADTVEEVIVENADSAETLQKTVELPEVTMTDWDTDVTYGPADLLCTLPQGFVDNGENEGLYVHKSYPTDISTISHVISEGEEDLSTWSAENFIEQLEQDYYDSYGDQVDITIVQNDKIKVDGRPGIRILMQFEFKEVSYEQLMYVFYNGTETHYVYYTQEQNGKWMDAFVESGESIHFQKAE